MKSSDIVNDSVGPKDQPRGLYNPEEFRDNCGFGMIAHQQGVPSHKLLQTAIESLTCMTHRGGIAADGKTGEQLRLAASDAHAVYAFCSTRNTGARSQEYLRRGHGLYVQSR